MKEIMTFIRRHKVPETKKALEDAGFPALTIQSVEGRGKQYGIGGWEAEVDPALSKLYSKELALESKVNWIPKRMLVLLVQDEEVELAVKTIINSNQTGFSGDGKIFVCPVEEVVRIRTEETGEAAVN